MPRNVQNNGELLHSKYETNFPIAISYQKQFKVDEIKRPSQRRSKYTLIRINHRKALSTVAIARLKHRTGITALRTEYHMVREWASPFSNLQITHSWKKKKMKKKKKGRTKRPCGSSRFAAASLNHRQWWSSMEEMRERSELKRELWALCWEW